jgi:hypothetical protein
VQITVFGQQHRNEFQHILNALRETRVPTASPTHVFFLLQSYPFEFSREFVHRLISSNSLTPLILIAGACCQGEERTGQPPQGVFRLYTWQWDSFYQHELEKHLNCKNSVFNYPLSTFHYPLFFEVS